MEKEFFDLLGLGVPFYLGAATYGVFAWLDNNASDEATKVITYWLHGRSQDKPDLGNLIISVFDRIYTLPLLSFRAFRRSAAISPIIWLLFAFVPTIILLSKSYPSPLIMIHFMWVSQFFIFDRIANLAILVVVDYISLFFVRLFLGYGRQHPTGASLLSSLIGLIVVIIGYFVFTIIVAAYIFPAFGAPLSSNIDALLYYISIVGSELLYLKVTGFTVGMVPALAIHLWLPLFALSTLIARLVFWIFRAVLWAQWFIKQGDAHPLKAIGIVATIIVFGSAMLVKEGWALS